MLLRTEPVTVGQDLLLFRAVDEPARRAMAEELLDGDMGGWGWRQRGPVDLWELHDATLGPDDRPVAAAGTRPLGDGRRVRLVAAGVAAPHRGRGIGRRMIEDLCDGLRARGVLVLVAAVPSDLTAGLAVLQQAGLRPSHVERSSSEADGRDVVWFDVDL